MLDKAKSSVLILIIATVISIAVAGGTFFLLNKEKAKAVVLREELDDIKTRLRITENNLEDSKKTIAGLGAKLQQAESQISALSADLQQEKAAKEEAKGVMEKLKSELDQQKTLRQDLERKFTEALKDAEKMQAQLKDFESKKNELEIKVKDLEEQTKQAQNQGVELGKIVVSPEAATPAAVAQKAVKAKKEKVQKAAPVESGLEGKVLVINKDYSFAVINVGSKDGVDVGNLFSVYHSNKYIGDIKVEKVHDSMAAAGFVATDMKDKVAEGDKVVRKTK